MIHTYQHKIFLDLTFDIVFRMYIPHISLKAHKKPSPSITVRGGFSLVVNMIIIQPSKPYKSPENLSWIHWVCNVWNLHPRRAPPPKGPKAMEFRFVKLGILGVFGVYLWPLGVLQGFHHLYPR